MEQGQEVKVPERVEVRDEAVADAVEAVNLPQAQEDLAFVQAVVSESLTKWECHAMSRSAPTAGPL
ncbi:MAG: hypothetical protein BBJ60_11575 [Desulfobacterales bacterium S7086C20]|nr:MAG: hypothetical protein BBJ60_11575 [Desulfobacterales bacterium S7086C20]